MWFVLWSGIIFEANEISMLTVDHFARDEHVSKIGKSACVRMFHSPYCVSASAQSEAPFDRIRVDFNPSGLGTDHIAHKTPAKTPRVIINLSQSKT